MSGTLGSSTARTFTEWMQQHDKVSVSGASEGWKKEERRRWRQRQWSDGHSVSMECVPSSQGTPLIGSAGAVNTSKKHHPTPPRISSAQPPQPSQPPQPTKKRIISSAPPSVDSYEGDPLAQSCVSGRGGSRNEANHSSSDWKSFALFHEVKLRELLSDDHRLPERGRLKKVLNHFKEISGVFPLFATVFQLILSEINLSVYATAASTLGVIEKIPYFEIITSLQKEKESLKSELFDARMEANQDTLLYELHTSRSRNRYLTHQVDKLNQENENLLEDVAKLNNEAEALSKNGRQAFNDLELQNRKAQSEIRRLTNEHTLMSYDNRSRLANINDYLSFKNKVSGSILPLFENKHEFSTYVQLMCQLELAENFHLSDYDTDLWSLTPIEIPPVRQKLLQKLRVIRAELHTLESYCKVLLVKDPHSKPAQPDPCEYEDADSKEEEDVQFSNPYNDSKAVEVPGDRTDVADETVQLPVPDGGGAPNPVLWREPVNNADVGVPFKEVMCELSGTSSQGREQFVENLTKKSRSVAQDILLATVNSLGDRVAASDPVQALKDNYLVPLLSTDPKKLDYSIDMFAVNGVSQEHVKTIYNIEPSCVMDVPAKTSAVCLKFSKPAGSTTLLAEKELSAQQQQAVAAGQHVTEPQLVEDFIADDEMKTLRARPGSHAVWQIYTQKAGVYTPRAPRTLSLRITEQIIQAAYHDKRNVVLSVFLEISASGATKEVKEKQFGASLKETDLMDSLFSVLDERYHLPPVVSKAAFETLATCEQANTPLTSYFLQSLIGNGEADITGGILSNALFILGREWPLSVLQPDVGLSQKETTLLLESLYPTFNATKIDSLISDIAIFTRANFSLTDIRAYFIDRIGSFKEHYMLDAAKAVAFKATTLKWKELDKFDFADACCSSINFTPDVSIDAVRERLKYRHQETCVRMAPGKTRLELKELGLLAAETTWLSMLEKVGGFLKPHAVRQ